MFVAKRWVSPYLLTPKKKEKRKTHGCSGEWVITFMTVKVGIDRGTIPGGALGYFLGGYVPPGTPNWYPVLEKISPKIDTPS